MNEDLHGLPLASATSKPHLCGIFGLLKGSINGRKGKLGDGSQFVGGTTRESLGASRNYCLHTAPHLAWVIQTALHFACHWDAGASGPSPQGCLANTIFFIIFPPTHFVLSRVDPQSRA